MRRPRLELPEWIAALPLVTLAFALTCVIATAVVQLGYEGRAEQIAQELREASSFAIQNPVVAVDPRLLPVIRGYMPGFESNETFAFLRRNDAKTRRVQKKFDQLDELAFASLDQHPFRVLGLVPSRPTPLGLAVHAFVQPGWLDLLATLVLLLLAGPLLEDLWGRAIYAVVLIGSTLFGAAAFGLVHGDADRALLGAAATVAGLVAAVTLRLRAEEVDFLRWLSPWLAAELVAPAWALTVAWGAYEGALWWMAQGDLPAGVDNAVGYTAHAVAALVAALSALAMQRLGGEERFGRRPAPVIAASALPERFDFQKVLAARARGDHDRAWQMLRAEVQRSARNRDAVNTLWEMAIERGAAAEAAPALRQLVSEELRRGAQERAVALWRELAEHAPNELPDAATMLRLIPCIREVDGDESAGIALQQLLGKSAGRLTPEQARQAVPLAREIAPQLAGAAARRALAASSLDDGARQELEAVAASATAPADPGAPPEPEEKPDLAPSVFYAESDRSAFGDAGVDLTALDDQFPRGAVREAVPKALGDEGLTLEIPGEGAIDLAWSRLRAVALAGVHGLGPRPVLLIDLVIDGGGTERPLSVVRLRSDRFDPRAFAAAGTAPLDAVRGLVGTLLARSRGRPLPDAAAAAAQPVKVYPALDAYHEQVLRPVGRELG